MLLVHDEQPEPFEANIALKQPVGADDDVDLASLDAFDRAGLRLVVDETRKHLDDDRKLCEALAKDVKVLLGKHGGRREKSHLLSAHGRLECRSKRQLGLSETDIAAQQAIHRAV